MAIFNDETRKRWNALERSHDLLNELAGLRLDIASKTVLPSQPLDFERKTLVFINDSKSFSKLPAPPISERARFLVEAARELTAQSAVDVRRADRLLTAFDPSKPAQVEVFVRAADLVAFLARGNNMASTMRRIEAARPQVLRGLGEPNPLVMMFDRAILSLAIDAKAKESGLAAARRITNTYEQYPSNVNLANDVIEVGAQLLRLGESAEGVRILVFGARSLAKQLDAHNSQLANLINQHVTKTLQDATPNAKILFLNSLLNDQEIVASDNPACGLLVAALNQVRVSADCRPPWSVRQRKSP
jgi:hypothetical protein